MLLGGDLIREYWQAGHIGFHSEFQAEPNIREKHIDVNIGEHYWEFTPPYRVTTTRTPFDIDADDPREFFTHRTARQAPGRHAIVLAPHSFVLAHTEQFVGGTVPWLCPRLGGRSSFARCGLTAHLAAGVGDQGFHGRWVMEIVNPHDIAIAIPLHARISCVEFERVDTKSEALYDSSYNLGPDQWTPESMLPRKGNFK